jgi:hypothetical protein
MPAEQIWVVEQSALASTLCVRATTMFSDAVQPRLMTVLVALSWIDVGGSRRKLSRSPTSNHVASFLWVLALARILHTSYHISA